jgi:putative ABC transport system substrate-binding protein
VFRIKTFKPPVISLPRLLLLTSTLVLPMCFSPTIVWADERRSARVAVLNPFIPPEPGYDAFHAELRELGYIEGKNLIIEVRWAEGRLERLPDLARELVALKPDVIFAPGEQGLRAAKDATTTIPIVVVACDPLDKLIKSLARPGGSATGLSCVHSELAGKRLEIMKEFLPNLSRAAVIYNPSDPNKVMEFGQLAAAGRQLGISLRAFEVTKAEAINPAYDSIVDGHAQSLIVLVDAFTIFHRQKLADLALTTRLPMGSGFKEFTDAGGLFSYGASRTVLFRRAANYVDKILKGTKPGDIPVEEPTRFEFFINQKTAKVLGITVPQSLLARADEVIE